MIDKIFIFIFGHFYFYKPNVLVNYTVCLNICDERQMRLPSAYNNDIILRQIKLLRIDQFKTSNLLTSTNGKQDYLTYFVGRLLIVYI